MSIKNGEHRGACLSVGAQGCKIVINLVPVKAQGVETSLIRYSQSLIESPKTHCDHS